MICGACGTKNAYDSKFCIECGILLINDIPVISAKKLGFTKNKIISRAGTLAYPPIITPGTFPVIDYSKCHKDHVHISCPAIIWGDIE